MISHLKGHVIKGAPGEVTVDVHGVGYRVSMPLAAWDTLPDNTEQMLWISTYVREDRLDLFGFADSGTRLLFEALIQLQGIGPRMGLELCSVPRTMILHAISNNDAKLLMSVKGIGKKTAEKLLIELKTLAEKHPFLFQFADLEHKLPAQYDRDAVAALTQLGYGTMDAMEALEKLPKELKTTEERVTAALRVL